MASSKSRPLPCGTPSMMSISTMSASSFAAIQCAAVAPTLPEPTIETLLRMDSPFENRVARNEILHHKGHDGSRRNRLVLTFVRLRVLGGQLLPYSDGRQHRRLHVPDNVVADRACLHL